MLEKYDRSYWIELSTKMYERCPPDQLSEYLRPFAAAKPKSQDHGKQTAKKAIE